MKESTAPVLLLGSPEQCADLRHATGFSAPDPIVLLIHRRRLHLVVPELEVGRARRRLPQARVWTPQELDLEGVARRRRGAWALALLRRLALQTARVPASFPLADGRLLAEAGITLDVAQTDSLRPERQVKTAVEIACIRQSQRAAAAGMRAARALIAQSAVDAQGFLRSEGRRLTSERVRAAVRAVVLAHGCLDSGTIVAGGAQAADPHEEGAGPLRAGEFIVVDLFPRHLEHGYWGDLTRTFVRGAPTARQRAMYAAVRSAQREALALIRHGARAADVHRRAAQVLEAAGFANDIRKGLPQGFIHSTGHGVGLEIHEAPSLSPSGGVLREGMVVTVEPGLYYTDLGGVRIEDTVVVTHKGFEHLVRFPIDAPPR